MDTSNPFLFRAAILIEVFAANGHSQTRLPAGTRINTARNDIEHCFDANNALTGVFDKLGDPREIVEFLWELEPQTGQEWLLEDDFVKQDAIVIFFVLFRDVQEHLFNTPHERTIGTWFEDVIGITEQDAIESLDAKYDIIETKRMMRKFKRWRAIYLGDARAAGKKARMFRTRDAVNGHQLRDGWQARTFHVGRYNFHLEKKKCAKRYRSAFERECHRRGGKQEMVDYLDSVVGHMQVRVSVNIPVAISVVKDAFKIKHMEDKSLQAKLDMGRDLIAWQDGAFIKLIQHLVETDEKLYRHVPQDHPDYGAVFDQVIDMLQ